VDVTVADVVHAVAEALRCLGPGLLDRIVVSTVTEQGGCVVVRVDGHEFIIRVQEITNQRGSA
jgi:hypothetical protein